MIFKDVDLDKLFHLMREYDISETTLRDGKTAVIVRRGKEQIVINNPGFKENQTQAASRFASTDNQLGKDENTCPAIEKQGKDEKLPIVESNSEKYYAIRAPLVGTFYRASTPEADPFVEVGDPVHVGDVLCIVEAMKSMNEIQADVNGVIKEICIENAQMVEYDQVIFKIDTSG